MQYERTSNRASSHDSEKDFFSSTASDSWVQLCVLTNGHWGYNRRSVKLTIRVYLVPRVRTRKAVCPVTHRFHGVVLNNGEINKLKLLVSGN